jgi:cytochrome c biogenesis protein CcdA
MCIFILLFNCINFLNPCTISVLPLLTVNLWHYFSGKAQGEEAQKENNGWGENRKKRKWSRS